MDADAYQALRQRCNEEYPAWVTVAESVETRLRHALKAAGIDVEVSARAKDVDSLLRKMVFKYKSDDLAKATDRAGARVVVHLPARVDDVRQIVRDLFPEHIEQDKSADYKPDQFFYRGVHFDATVPESGVDTSAVTGALICEIQVRTVAEHAWSVLSHLLTYKSPGEDAIPDEMRRRINRLIAIVELFDLEATAAHTDITMLPEYAAHRLVYDLERLHNGTVGDHLPSLRRCDPEFVAAMLSMYEAGEVPIELLDAFAAANGPKLEATVSTYGDEISPFVRQPEAFILWERLDHDEMLVSQWWDASGYPRMFLDDMAVLWGLDLQEG